MMLDAIREIWAYRDFIKGSILREFQSRYYESLLGVFWLLLNPLVTILVYTLIFSKFMGAKLPGVEGTFSYSIFLCAGILVWGLFTEITGRFQKIFNENAQILKKIKFPILTLPIISLTAACLNFSIIFGLFSAFLIFFKSFPGLTYLYIFPLLIIQIIFSIGIGMCIGILNVFFRDTSRIFNLVIQFWFWLTPIVYPLSILPNSVRQIIELNPITPLVVSYQNIFLYEQSPRWLELQPTIFIGIILCLISLRLYRKHADEIIDEL